MRSLRIPHCVLVLLLVSSSAQAQTGNWSAVQNLPPGTIISVKAPGRHHLQCYFDHADDETLSCEHIERGRIYFGSSEIVVARRDVQEVRLEHSDSANAAAGAAIGAVAGAALGASKSNARLGGALLIGGIGATFGGFFARDFHVLRGKIIYQR